MVRELLRLLVALIEAWNRWRKEVERQRLNAQDVKGKVDEAKKVRDRLATDPDYYNRMREQSKHR